MNNLLSTLTRKAFPLNALAAVGAMCVWHSALADNFPSRPITMVVPFSAGGSSDVIARLLAQPLSQQLGQPVVVDNRPGAGATIGTAYAAKKGAEGYVVILAENTQTVAPALYERLTYDAVNDFAVVGYIGESPAILAASKASGIKSLPELLERTKKTPLGATIGTGNGTTSHFMSELYQLRSSTKLQSVPYKGAAPALNDLLAGHIDLVFTNTVSASSYLTSGGIVPVAVAAKARDKRFPNVPTFQESGVNLQTNYWFALLMPADTPEEAKARWRKELGIALARPEMSRKLAEIGIDKVNVTPAQGQALLKDEADLWKTVAKSAGIKAN